MPFKAEGTTPVNSKICPQNFDVPCATARFAKYNFMPFTVHLDKYRKIRENQRTAYEYRIRNIIIRFHGIQTTH